MKYSRYTINKVVMHLHINKREENWLESYSGYNPNKQKHSNEKL